MQASTGVRYCFVPSTHCTATATLGFWPAATRQASVLQCGRQRNVESKKYPDFGVCSVWPQRQEANDQKLLGERKPACREEPFSARTVDPTWRRNHCVVICRYRDFTYKL